MVQQCQSAKITIILNKKKGQGLECNTMPALRMKTFLNNPSPLPLRIVDWGRPGYNLVMLAHYLYLS